MERMEKRETERVQHGDYGALWRMKMPLTVCCVRWQEKEVGVYARLNGQVGGKLLSLSPERDTYNS